MLHRLTGLLLVKEREQSQVAFFAALFLLLGSGLALGRGTADVLFFKRYGIEHLPGMYALLSVAFLAVSLAYAAYADRLSAERFFQIIFAVLFALVGFSWTLMTFTDAEFAYPLYFVVFEIGSELLLLHSMLYMAQNFETLQAKRLTPLIFAAAQLGTILGGIFLAAAAHWIGVQNIMLVWLIEVGLALILIRAWHRRHGASPHYQPRRRGGAAISRSIDEIVQGIRFARGSSLLRASSFALFFMVIVFYILCYSVNRIYNDAFPGEAQLGAFFGTLTAVTSTTALIIQVFITSRLLHRFGIKAVNLMFPVSTVISYLGLIAIFALPAALFGSFTKDVLVPAIRRPVRNLFFNALPKYIQGRARALSVALVLPVALGCASAILLIAQKADAPVYFLVPSLIASLCYVFFTTKMNKAYLSAMLVTLRERLFVPGSRAEQATESGDKEIVGELVRGIGHSDPEIAASSARLLIESAPERAPDIIIRKLEHLDRKVRDQLICLLTDAHTESVTKFCWAAMNNGASQADAHYRATLARVLFLHRHPEARSLVADYLEAPNPRVATMGVFGVHQYQMSHLMDKAKDRWRSLLQSSKEGETVAAIGLLTLRPLPELFDELISLLTSPHQRIQQAALVALGNWPEGEFPQLTPILNTLYESLDPEVRQAVVAASRLLPGDSRDLFCLRAVEDSHPKVQELGFELLDKDGDQFAEMIASWVIANVGSPRVQRAALGALVRERPAQQVFEEIVEAKVADAQELSLAVRACEELTQSASSDRSPQALLTTVLEERRQEAIDLAVLAMENVEDPATIAIIRAGLSSMDGHDAANAREVLRHLDNRHLAEQLDDLLEDVDRVPRERAPLAGLFRSVEQLLDWCERRPDQWLRECAQLVRHEYTTRGKQVV